MAERHIKIALCELPTMLDDIITVLVGDEPNVEIVARIERSDDLRSDFERTGADLVICSVKEREMASLWADAVSRRPLPAFLNVGDNSTRASLYSTQCAELRLEELTARSLLDALQDHLRSLPSGGDG